MKRKIVLSTITLTGGLVILFAATVVKINTDVPFSEDVITCSGDTLTLNFGSSPKQYAFSVARIAAKGRHCAIFSEAAGDRHQMDKINVAPCFRVDEGR